jgi:hypothetical protein
MAMKRDGGPAEILNADAFFSSRSSDNRLFGVWQRRRPRPVDSGGIERTGYVARVAGIPNIPLGDMEASPSRMPHLHMVAAIRRHNRDMDVW